MNVPKGLDDPKQLNILYEISKEINREISIQALLRLAIDKIIACASAQHGFIGISGEAGDYKLECSRDYNGNDVKAPDSETSSTIIIEVLSQKESIVLEDASDYSHSSRELGLISVACTPLKIKDKVIGFIYLDNRDQQIRFDKDTELLLEEISDLISPSIYKSFEIWRLSSEQTELKSYGSIIGDSTQMKEVYEKIEHFADTDISVLILGDTGTGKDLVANELHKRSRRNGFPLLAVNTSAIPNTLLEAELFGYEKGAFNGAYKQHHGYFEQADKSSIFLDEIGDIPLETQIKLLRVIEHKTFRRVMGPEIQTDVRIIAATNRNIKKRIETGLFREDLYQRFVATIHLPPLRDRETDVITLADHFLNLYKKKYSKDISGFSSGVYELFIKYEFPGNVRELQSMIELAVLVAKGEVIHVHDLDIKNESIALVPYCKKNFKKAKKIIVDRFEKEFIIARLKETKGNIDKAARNSGMHPANFRQKMDKHKISNDHTE